MFKKLITMKGSKVMLQRSNLEHNTAWNTMDITCKVEGLDFTPAYTSEAKYKLRYELKL